MDINSLFFSLLRLGAGLNDSIELPVMNRTLWASVFSMAQDVCAVGRDEQGVYAGAYVQACVQRGHRTEADDGLCDVAEKRMYGGGKDGVRQAGEGTESVRICRGGDVCDGKGVRTG